MLRVGTGGRDAPRRMMKRVVTESIEDDAERLDRAFPRRAWERDCEKRASDELETILL